MDGRGDILIVGAGPTGLTAALELARRGLMPRIIDKADGPHPESRALAINPRSLEILEPSGVTAELLKAGLRIRALNFWDPPQKLFTVPVTQLEHRFKFILSLPQYETEKILIQRLKDYGAEVEWQVELVDFKIKNELFECVMQDGAKRKTTQTKRLIGADGAHSIVRKKAGIGFRGSAYEHDWSLADVALDGPPAHDEVNIYRIGCCIFGAIPFGRDRYRIVSDTENVEAMLPEGFKLTDVDWNSNFRISHRQVETYQKGDLFLAGDAAHVHSPVGGRGMNLGIEDAATLAWMIDLGDTRDYTRKRLPIGRNVIRTVDMMTRFVTSMNPVLKFVRRRILPLLLKSDFILARALPNLAGVADKKPDWLD